MVEFLLNNFDFLTPELANYISYFLMGLVYYVITAAIHYYDNRYAGKQGNFLLDYIILPLVKRVLVRIEPGKVGRRIVEKKHPDSANAKRDVEDGIWMNIH